MKKVNAVLEHLEIVHELKTIPTYFKDILSGEKTFDVRSNDRLFGPGDKVIFREWTGKRFTGRRIAKRVSYVMALLPPGFAKVQSDGSIVGKTIILPWSGKGASMEKIMVILGLKEWIPRR